MDTIVSLVAHLVALGLVVAGGLWVLGLTGARDRVLRLALRLVAFAVLLPCALAFACDQATRLATDLPRSGVRWPTIPSSVLWAVVLGHLALVIVLVRRRLLGVEAQRRRAAELERARMRERPRLPPELGESDE
ncbi:MAG: hypothetical protein OZ928_20935 [Polyangiaceae bacterium]|nr:hypothetical protein [Polyangiaceae bacterium]